MIADILTKPKRGEEFKILRSKRIPNFLDYKQEEKEALELIL